MFNPKYLEYIIRICEGGIQRADMFGYKYNPTSRSILPPWVFEIKAS